MKVAILDLGTHVFNLLTADISDGKCKIERVVKIPSFIGSGGFSSGLLSLQTIESSVEVFGELMKEVKNSGGADLIKAFATSAIRDARNGQDFIKIISQRFGVEVETISGDREAELTYKGIRESVFLYDEKVLMCDIGGGSNELIIADKNKIYWKESFNLGVVRLRELFNPEDPIKERQVEDIESYLEKSLYNLWTACKQYKPVFMIGSSGSFDTLRELLYTDDDSSLPARELDMEKLRNLHEILLKSTREERMQMPRMTPFRVDYMVLGSIFVQLVIKRCNIQELYQSSYSLKEGGMTEIAESINKKQTFKL
ncbi:MAG: hypothetical protein A2X18_10385 [Bacteroidetes bacterium GWF2_40_14]|nr:MAG: hypothetical protein A2X18_10385 [Bacteroidetes bacterium GWF2_40_14]